MSMCKLVMPPALALTVLVSACFDSGRRGAEVANSAGQSGAGGSGLTAAGSTGAAMAESDGTSGRAGASSAVSYTTNFDGTESPISEKGAWHHVDQELTLVNMSGGNAYGTEDGLGDGAGGIKLDDSNAYLSGFPPDQRASAVIHLAGGIAPPGLQEVELLLRWSDSAHAATGYECNLAWDGSYVQIGRFMKTPALYDSLTHPGSAPGTIHDGDVFSAEVVGNAITVRLNGKIIASATDRDGAAGGGPPITAGNPGIGFFRWSRGGPTDSQSYAFTSFTATSLAR